MNPIQTDTFKWSHRVSHYNVDLGNNNLETLLPECYYKDAAGKVIRQFYGSQGGWGIGSAGIGGDSIVTALPKTLHLSYYDYIEDRFYVLDAELNQTKIHALFKQKSLDIETEKVVPRYDALRLGIGPQGHVMIWVSQRIAQDQVELGRFRAIIRKDITIKAYNEGRSFVIEDRWSPRGLGGSNGLKPDTIAKIKAGWYPSPDYYFNTQRVMYPWRYRMTGNATLVEYKDRLGNTDNTRVWPYELAVKQSLAMLRGLPRNVQLFFTDKERKRHSVFVKFFTQERVSSEPDLSAVRAAFDKLYPGRTVDNNMDYPSEAEMATVEIHVGDDLETYTATLVKGDIRIPLTIAPRPQVLDLEPYSHYRDVPTPPAAFIKLLKEGPPH